MWVAHVSAWGFVSTTCKFWDHFISFLLRISFRDSWSGDAQDLCFLAYIVLAANKVSG
jgi:hypothetical protein